MDSEETSKPVSLDAPSAKEDQNLENIVESEDATEVSKNKELNTPDLDIVDNINNIGQVPLLQDVDTISSDMPDVGNLQMPQQSDIINQSTASTETSNVSSEPSQEKNQSTNTFSLGVPGLSFSQDNVKTAPDGTKMVQIHQSQITPEQLESLQKNPNIKVVFRHIPSGRSFTKPPKHLMPRKRKSQQYKASMTHSNNADIYDFNEGVDFYTNSNQNPAYDAGYRKYMRYNDKKKGRPRSIPDPTPFDNSVYKSLFKSNTKPTQVIINELLGKLNKENPLHTIKIHMAQVTAEILANLELHPDYNISILTPEEELELEEKNVEAEEEENEEVAEPSKSTEATEDAMEVEEIKPVEEKCQEPEEEDELAKAVDDLEQKLAEEKKKAEKLEAARLRKQKEDEELERIANEKKVSRSGRIRKPSKYALDIARLTRKRNIDSGDEETVEPAASPESVASPPNKRKRGRPTKTELAAKDSSDDASVTLTPIKSNSQKDAIKTSPEKVASPSKSIKPEDPEKKIEDVPEKVDEKDDTTLPKEKESEESLNMETQEESRDKEGESEKTADQTENLQNNEATESEKKEEEAKDDTLIKNTEENSMLSKEDLLLDNSDEQESGEVDNKFRLTKLLEQCSVDEIRSVFIPKALDSLNLGDFLLFKANQMHNENDKISFPKLYEQFEAMHKSMAKEGNRYNVMVKRANKVGGDKRMDKVVLMPVYHREAASALNIVTTSIDAHICGVQRSNTAQMIAANSFLLRTKMEPPKIHLKLPETTAPGNPRSRYTNTRKLPSAYPKTYNAQNKSSAGLSSNVTRKNWSNKNQFGSALKGGLSYRNPTTVHLPKSHKTNGFNSSNTFEMPTATLRSVINNTVGVNNAKTDQNKNKSINAVEFSQNTKETSDQTVVSASDSGDQFLISDTTAGTEGEVQKHLVPIGDGQFVELPEGYSLIQTDEGYIIGQPGSTFTQGEDGSLYITNSDGTDITDITQVISTEAGEITTTTTES